MKRKKHLFSTILTKSATPVFFQGLRILLIDERSFPFSFSGNIYVNADAYKNGTITPDLIMHEYAHLRQHHSLDIIFIEMLQIVFWFNPLIIWYRKSIRLNHEFLADSMVLKTADVYDYQKQLLNLYKDK